MRTLIPAAAIAALVAGCQSATDQDAAATDEGPTVAQLVEARQGEGVDSLCFTGQINGWEPLGDKALLVRRGVNDWYKMDLTGTCRPDQAFASASIAVGGGRVGSSCLRPGDRIDTREPGVGVMSCSILSIHEWDEEAPVAEEADASTLSDG